MVYQVRNNDGTTTDILPANMLHIRGLGDDKIGWSIARVGIESLGLTLAAQSFGSGFFGNNSSLGGVLYHPERMDPEGLERLRKEWSEMYSGPENSFKPAILEDGMKWERLGVPPEEGQFLESRQFQIEEIARWFRMPPHKIQHLLRATFSNVDEQNIEYVVDTLTPWLVRWEQEIRMKLLPQENDIFCEHLIHGLMRGDPVKRGDYFTKMFMIGAYSQNIILEMENMNTIGPDGDTRYVPLNMIRSQDAAAGLLQDPAAAVTESAPAPPAMQRKRPGKMPPEDDDMEDDDEARVRAAFGPLFFDAAQRLLQKEQNAADRAEKRFAGKPEAFAKWLDEFYDLHQVTTEQTFRRIAGAGAKILGGAGWNPAEFARLHVETSKAELRRLFATCQIATVFPDYTKKHGEEMAEKALKEVCNGKVCV
jgi:hypothetical protein